MPATYDHWDEDATYTENGGTVSFSGEWTVPSAPTNTTNTTIQTIFYFLGLQNGVTPTSKILQPVLQWGQTGRKEWEIQSYYANTTIIDNSSYVAVAVGDTLNAGITQESYNPGWWNIDIVDMTQSVQEGLRVYDNSTYSNNFVTLETYNVNTCDQFPGSADFYNLNVDNLSLTWIPEQRQTGCGLDITKVSPSEVILKTKPLADWNHSKLETITGTTAGAQTNYQMKLTLYNSTGTDTPGNVYLGGNVRSDFGDIRFTKSDGITLLNYWIESYTPGVSAVVWVKVDSIPASPGTANIYLYYGNPSATSVSNGDATFLFFDDFLGNSINTSKWSTFGGVGSVAVSNSIVTITAPYGSWSGMTGQTFLAPPHAFRGRVQFAQPGSIRNGFGAANYNGLHDTYFDTELDSSPQRLRADNTANCRSSSSWTYNAYSIFEVRWTSTKARYFENDIEKSGSPVTGSCIPTDNQGVYFETWNAHISSDWVLIRNYADPEPTWG